MLARSVSWTDRDSGGSGLGGTGNYVVADAARCRSVRGPAAATAHGARVTAALSVQHIGIIGSSTV